LAIGGVQHRVEPLFDRIHRRLPGIQRVYLAQHRSGGQNGVSFFQAVLVATYAVDGLFEGICEGDGVDGFF
jgi:hypothetical protein